MEVRATWRVTLIHDNGDNMKCLNCGNSSFVRPVDKSSLEIWHCNECGNDCAVHCSYIPDPSGMQISDLFIGTATVGPGPDALKSLMKLKRILAFAERFEPALLETQYREGKHEWDLGYFLDFEVQQASAMCKSAGISVTFEIVRYPPEQNVVVHLEQPLANYMGSVPVRDVIMVALQWPTEHWPSLAVSWIEQGALVDRGIVAMLGRIAVGKHFSQRLRHRARTLHRRHSQEPAWPPNFS